MTDAQTGVDAFKWLATNYGFSGLVAVAALVSIGYLTKAMLGIIAKQAEHWPSAIANMAASLEALRSEQARAEVARRAEHAEAMRAIEKR